LPVIVTLENLDEDALVKIIRDPKNSLYKQYKKLFELDGIELEIEEDAFRAIAHLAIEREIGARGLRSIIEGLMMKPMYELPSNKDVKKVIITEGFVKGNEELKVIYDSPALPEA
jgi:ATP-dependent Clp protease ATP-binding subunit ClpX